MNTQKLKEIIYSTLKTYSDNVFFQLASDTSTMPIIVFDIPTVYNNDNTGIWRGMLTVDVYDTDLSSLETLVDSLQLLNLQLKHNDITTTQFYIDDIQYISTEENTNIHRKRLNLELLII